MRGRRVMVMLVGLIGLVGLPVGPWACGDDDPELSEKEAAVAISEAMALASRVYTHVAGGLGKLDDSWVSGSAGSYTIKGSMTGAQKGSAAVTGSGSKSGNTASFKVEVALTGWKATSEQIFDGTLSLTFEVENLAGALMTVTYKGEISVSGSAQAPASFDVKVVHAGPGKDTICGTVSGKDVSTGTCD